jgi:hypothetical protein
MASVSLLALMLPAIALAQRWPDTGADAVESFAPGSGAGYGAQYFPANVLGLPDSTARADVATVEPKQILSLGLGGEIVLRFDRAPIVDTPGPDFTVFENAFDYVTGGKSRRYAEPAEVAVSRDGKSFIPFPFDSLTLRGCAGVTPTHGDRDPGDPALSGGDGFDLHDLGIDSVRYVRLRDVTAIVKNNPSSPFWDMTLNGFDLDAVVRATTSRPASSGVDAPVTLAMSAAIAPNPSSGSVTLTVSLPSPGHLGARVLDLLGHEVLTIAGRDLPAGETRIGIDAGALPDGFYLIVIEKDGRRGGTIGMRHIR